MLFRLSDEYWVFVGGSKYGFMFFVDLKFYIELMYFFFLNEIIRLFEI